MARSSEETRTKLLDAAEACLIEKGAAGTSIRAVAAKADVNSALISYHFGGIDQLLIAVLARSSDRRMGEYQAAMAGASTPEDFARAATEIYRRDVEEGQITIFTEILGASLSKPELRPALVEQTGPWIAFVETGVRGVLDGSPLEDVVPPEDLAFALLAFYLGINMMTYLDEGGERTERVFALAEQIAPMLSPILSAGPVSKAVLKGFATRAKKRSKA